MEVTLEQVQRVADSYSSAVTQGKKYYMFQVGPTRVKEACAAVSGLPGLYHLSTITAVDEGQAISLLYHFWEGSKFVTVRTTVPKSAPTVETVTGVLPAALLYEGEIADLFGVKFEGNPLSGQRLLLPDNYPEDAPPPLTKEADPAKIRRSMGLE
jgi:Ni,Fe-hydrogenase III component G